MPSFTAFSMLIPELSAGFGQHHIGVTHFLFQISLRLPASPQLAAAFDASILR